MNDPDKAARHNQRMARKKVVVDEAIAAAQQERGVLVVNMAPARASRRRHSASWRVRSGTA